MQNYWHKEWAPKKHCCVSYSSIQSYVDLHILCYNRMPRKLKLCHKKRYYLKHLSLVVSIPRSLSRDIDVLSILPSDVPSIPPSLPMSDVPSLPPSLPMSDVIHSVNNNKQIFCKKLSVFSSLLPRSFHSFNFRAAERLSLVDTGAKGSENPLSLSNGYHSATYQEPSLTSCPSLVLLSLQLHTYVQLRGNIEFLLVGWAQPIIQHVMQWVGPPQLVFLRAVLLHSSQITCMHYSRARSVRGARSSQGNTVYIALLFSEDHCETYDFGEVKLRLCCMIVPCFVAMAIAMWLLLRNNRRLVGAIDAVHLLTSFCVPQLSYKSI